MGLQGNQVPSVGWTWMSSSDGQSWSPERQIQVGTPASPCLSVEVILKGEASEKEHLCKGIYHIVDEVWSAGRQVRSIAILIDDAAEVLLFEGVQTRGW